MKKLKELIQESQYPQLDKFESQLKQYKRKGLLNYTKSLNNHFNTVDFRITSIPREQKVSTNLAVGYNLDENYFSGAWYGSKKFGTGGWSISNRANTSYKLIYDEIMKWVLDMVK